MPRNIFYRTALQRIVTAINKENNLSLTVSNCIISKPSPISGSWKEMNTTKNTVVKVSQVVPAVTYNGRNWCMYNRVQLSAFLNQLPNPTSLAADAPKTTHDLLRAINRRWGMGLETTDIINEPITLDADGKGQVAIIAHPESLMWIGSHTFNVVQGDARLDENVTTTTMPGFTYPNGSVDHATNYGYAQPYSYQFNFTLRSDLLHAFTTGTTLTGLADILTYITGTTWLNSGSDGVRTYTLDGAEITYNGLNNANLPTNSAFKYVMIVKTGANCILKGNLYIQFNDVDDPNSPN